MCFPIEEVRKQFPALNRTYHGRSVVYLDGPGGSQVLKSSIDAMVKYMESGGANLHGSFPSSRETEQIIADSKQAVADFLGAHPQEVAFGANMTTLALAISRALGQSWGEGGEIVLSEIDHRANVDPWLLMARDHGLTVKWIEVDPDGLTLNLENLDSLITEKTRLVAVSLASNAVGTVNDVKRIARRAREVGALVAVDAVHAAPHLSIDRDDLDVDILLCSAYKFFGPHVGIAVIRSEVFEALRPYKLSPAPEHFPDKLETGTQNHEGIAGIKPAIDFFDTMGVGENRRDRIVSGIKRIEEYENQLANQLREALSQMENVTLYQADDTVPKTPTIAFQIEGIKPQDFCRVLADEHGIFAADGDFYATTLAEKLDINKSGGWIRVGIAPYNTEEEVERFIEAVSAVIR
ncbi:cysteine desulfurase-like protein [Bacillus fonticola]|uniref:cysteine desulfurase-like protein n=1 Tax=Bacillus fonticola TaxID=2728853 RepID=UPI001475738C|nr:cysteine desulfurase-like protein [Bacillus fonticola]